MILKKLTHLNRPQVSGFIANSAHGPDVMTHDATVLLTLSRSDSPLPLHCGADLRNAMFDHMGHHRG